MSKRNKHRVLKPDVSVKIYTYIISFVQKKSNTYVNIIISWFIVKLIATIRTKKYNNHSEKSCMI